MTVFLTKKKKLPICGILILWGLVSAFNLTKALHIDDPYYVTGAEWILENPLKPLSYEINWGDTPGRGYDGNNPPLTNYCLAICAFFFGESEFALHLMTALFSFTAILFFYLLSQHFLDHGCLFLTFLCFASPCFIPVQNLMLDVPMLAFWLVFFWIVLDEKRVQRTGWQILAGVIVGLACLTKYTSVILFPLFFLAIAIRRKFSSLWVLIVPGGILALWCLWNYMEYGGIHIAGRPTPPLDSDFLVSRVKMVVSLLTCLGALCPWSLVFFRYLLKDRMFTAILTGCLVLFLPVETITLLYSESSLGYGLLRSLFFVNGICVILLMCGCAVRGYRRAGKEDTRSKNLILLTMGWLGIDLLFLVGFSPFMAVRHVLTFMPPLLFILGPELIPHGIRREFAYAGIALTVLLGVCLGIADWRYADVYRTHAPRLAKRVAPQHTTWALGHWGWQWYASKSGFRIYDSVRSRLMCGDVVVVPGMVVKQVLAKRDRQRIELMETVPVKRKWTDLLQVMSASPWGGYCSNDYLSIPWFLDTRQPLEKFSLFRVTE